MIYISKHSTPLVLRKYQSLPNARYDDIPSQEKDEIKNELLSEQHCICAYCMSRITMATSSIEHWFPQHTEDEEYDRRNSLDYGNMLAVCTCSRGKDYQNQTCDVRKGNKKITVNPCDIHTMEKIDYKSSGLIFSQDEEIDNDLNDALNLNCEESSLPVNRKAALEQLYREVDKGCKNGKSKKTVCESIMKQISQKTEYIPYYGIIEWKLKKWLQ